MNSKQIKELASEYGRRGGIAMFKKLGKKHMSRMGKKGAAIRWAKKK